MFTVNCIRLHSKMIQADALKQITSGSKKFVLEILRK